MIGHVQVEKWEISTVTYSNTANCVVSFGFFQWLLGIDAISKSFGWHCFEQVPKFAGKGPKKYFLLAWGKPKTPVSSRRNACFWGPDTQPLFISRPSKKRHEPEKHLIAAQDCAAYLQGEDHTIISIAFHILSYPFIICMYTLNNTQSFQGITSNKPHQPCCQDTARSLLQLDSQPRWKAVRFARGWILGCSEWITKITRNGREVTIRTQHLGLYHIYIYVICTW